MLKIKDNVDLKELEKFGFEKNSFYYKKIGRSSFIDIDADKIISLYVGCKDVHLVILEKQLDILFDLIQAGLVEKVEG